MTLEHSKFEVVEVTSAKSYRETLLDSEKSPDAVLQEEIEYEETEEGNQLEQQIPEVSNDVVVETERQKPSKKRASITKKRPKCRICLKTFVAPHTLRRHHEAIHLKIKRYECDNCGKRVFAKQELIPHMRTHSRVLLSVGIYGRSHQLLCHICPKSFTREMSLKNHSSKFLKNERMYFNNDKYLFSRCSPIFVRLRKSLRSLIVFRCIREIVTKIKFNVKWFN